MSKTSKKPWIVQQMNWHVYGLACYDHEEDHGLPVAVFASKKKAEAHCKALEEQARRELSPAQFFEEAEMATSLDEKTLVKRIQALSLPAPEKQERQGYSSTYVVLGWDDWWDRCSPEMTDEQRTAVWDLFDRLCFYKVVQADQTSE
jgi:hypothetical protein